jgi:hypothetical protein
VLRAVPVNVTAMADRRPGSAVPGIDAGARARLAARFGDGVEAWFDELPGRP